MTAVFAALTMPAPVGGGAPIAAPTSWRGMMYNPLTGYFIAWTGSSSRHMLSDGYLYQSTDGLVWQRMSNTALVAISIGNVMVSGTALIIIGNASNGGYLRVRRSLDNGLTWTIPTGGLENEPFMSIYEGSGQANGALWVNTGTPPTVGRCWRSIDDGASWAMAVNDTYNHALRVGGAAVIRLGRSADTAQVWTGASFNPVSGTVSVSGSSEPSMTGRPIAVVGSQLVMAANVFARTADLSGATGWTTSGMPAWTTGGGFQGFITTHAGELLAGYSGAAQYTTDGVTWSARSGLSNVYAGASNGAITLLIVNGQLARLDSTAGAGAFTLLSPSFVNAGP